MSDHTPEPFEEFWPDLFREPEEPLFEEEASAEDGPGQDDALAALEGRVDTLEYRLGRTLQCVNRCQKDQTALRREHRDLQDTQNACLNGQKHLRKALALGIGATAAIALAGHLPQLAAAGWQLLTAAASLLGADPSIAAGGLLAVILLWLGFRLGRSLLRRLTQRTERSDPHAVSDR